MKQQQAFTLIELLVVVAIIALLISILLPSLERAREAAKRVVCAHNLNGISTASKTYAHDHNGTWPTVATYFADASLFPKCAEINPYLTIMSLADRTAERVRSRIRDLASV